MSDRERRNYRAFMAEEAAREQAEQAERERPIREAQARLVQTSNKLAALQRERVAGVGGLKDEESFADPIYAGRKILKSEAKQINATEFAIFKRDNPDLHLNRANGEAIFDYLVRNDIEIATAETYRRAYDRLAEFNLLEDRPVLEPEPEPEPTPEPVVEPTPETFDGWDLQSGEPRTYSKFEVERMSSDEYKRVFRIYKDRQTLAKARW